MRHGFTWPETLEVTLAQAEALLNPQNSTPSTKLKPPPGGKFIPLFD